MKKMLLLEEVLFYLVLIIIAVMMIMPFAWSVSTSLKPDIEIFKFPPNWIPRVWVFSNYQEAWRAANFSRYFINSIIVATAGLLLTLFACSLAGYAFSKLEFIGREVLFWFVLASLMIPWVVTLIPTFLIVKSIPFAGGNNILGQGGRGWLNTYWGLIIPGGGQAFGVFLLRQFFKSIPRDLSDAAKIDGYSEFGIFCKIILPLSKPALATLGIFTFQFYWNDFLWPLVIISSDKMRTIQLGLTVFQHEFDTNWGQLMSGTIMSIVPMLVIFLCLQRYFVRGIVLSGMKG